MKKLVVLTSIGTGLEYYDFVVYAFLAKYIAQIFFPNYDSSVGLIAAFGVFAAGYLARPIGGVLLSNLGDKIGRKKIFSTAILFMGITTFAIGLIPDYTHWGKVSAIILLLLRIIQSMLYGTELPVALTFLVEHVHEKRRGISCGYMIASVGFGVTFASLILYLLHHFLQDQEILTWGWRIPFLLGGVLAIFGYIIRKNTQETPSFLQNREINTSTIKLLKKYTRNIMLGFGIMAFPASMVVFLLSLPTYLQIAFNYQGTSIFLVNVIGYVWSSLLIPVFGKLSDHVGRNKLLALTMLVFICVAVPLFQILNYQSVISLLIFMICIQTIVAAMAGCYFVMLAENFPINIRCTGIALCYNGAYAVAALIPVIIGCILRFLHNSNYVAFFLIAVSCCTFASSLAMKKQARKIF